MNVSPVFAQRNGRCFDEPDEKQKGNVTTCVTNIHTGCLLFYHWEDAYICGYYEKTKPVLLASVRFCYQVMALVWTNNRLQKQKRHFCEGSKRGKRHSYPAF